MTWCLVLLLTCGAWVGGWIAGLYEGLERKQAEEARDSGRHRKRGD